MPQPRPVTIVTDDGPISFQTTREACRFMHCHTSDFGKRVKKLQASGLTHDEAATKFYAELLTHRANRAYANGPKPVTIQTDDGPLTFSSIAAALHATGRSSSSTLLNRLRAQGLSDDDAMTICWNRKNRTHDMAICIDGIRYANAHDACDKLRLDYKKVVSFSGRKSIPIKDAILLYIERQPKPNVVSCVINGVSYESLAAACHAFGYKRRTLQSAAKHRGIEPVQLLSEWASTNYTVGKHQWTETDDDLIRRYYPIFGTENILPCLFQDSAHSVTAVRTRAVTQLKLKNIPPTDETHAMSFAYKTENNHFFYWYYCKRYNTFMLISADEIIDYMAHPSIQFCHEHRLPPFVHIPCCFMSRATDKSNFSYQTWLAANQEVTPDPCQTQSPS